MMVQASQRTIPLFALAAAVSVVSALCIGACPKGILALDEHRVNVQGYHPVRLTNPDACTSDAHCARVCPDCVFTILARPRPDPVRSA